MSNKPKSEDIEYYPGKVSDDPSFYQSLPKPLKVLVFVIPALAIMYLFMYWMALQAPFPESFEEPLDYLFLSLILFFVIPMVYYSGKDKQ